MPHPVASRDEPSSSREALPLLVRLARCPPLYVERYGHPRLRARHLLFPIASASETSGCRDDGGACRALIDDVPSPPRGRTRTADHMRNADVDGVPGSADSHTERTFLSLFTFCALERNPERRNFSQRRNGLAKGAKAQSSTGALELTHHRLNARYPEQHPHVRLVEQRVLESRKPRRHRSAQHIHRSRVVDIDDRHPVDRATTAPRRGVHHVVRPDDDSEIDRR